MNHLMSFSDPHSEYKLLKNTVIITASLLSVNKIKSLYMTLI